MTFFFFEPLEDESLSASEFFLCAETVSAMAVELEVEEVPDDADAKAPAPEKSEEKEERIHGLRTSRDYVVLAANRATC